MSNPLNTIQTMKWDVGGEGCKIWRRKKRKKKSTKCRIYTQQILMQANLMCWKQWHGR